MRRFLLLLAVVAAAGCGGSDGSNGKPELTDPATALGLSGGTNVIVRGFISFDPGAIRPRMCQMLEDTYPPACEMPSLPVSNLSDEQVTQLQLTRDPETGGRWSQKEVELRGRIEEGALVVS
jgi:hypothetical protein